MTKKQKALSKKDKAMIKKALLKKVVKVDDYVDVYMEIDFVSRLVAAIKQINQT